MSDLPDWAKTQSVETLAQLTPEVFDKFVQFENAVYEPGALSAKFKELLAVGITHVTQCDACITYHTHKAKQAGATDEEVAEAVWVAMSLRAGAALGHFDSASKVIHHHRDKAEPRSKPCRLALRFTIEVKYHHRTHMGRETSTHQISSAV